MSRRRAATSVVQLGLERGIALLRVGFEIKGNPVEYTMIAMPRDAVEVLPWRGVGNSTEALAIRQFWPAAGDTFSLVGATLKEGEDPRETAIREMEEEVGIRPADVLNLHFVGRGIQLVNRSIRGVPQVGDELIPHSPQLMLAEVRPDAELGETHHEAEEEIEVIGWRPAEELLREVLEEGKDECFMADLVVLLQILCLCEAGVII